MVQFGHAPVAGEEHESPAAGQRQYAFYFPCRHERKCLIIGIRQAAGQVEDSLLRIVKG